MDDYRNTPAFKTSRNKQLTVKSFADLKMMAVDITRKKVNPLPVGTTGEVLMSFEDVSKSGNTKQKRNSQQATNRAF